MDDTHTMFVSLSWKNLPPERAALSTTRGLPGSKLTMDFVPNTTDWYGRWRLAGNAANDWLIDREAQRNGGIYTGITGIQAQDQAVTESMGGITDHAFENLAPSDLMIARTRRRLLRAARASTPPCAAAISSPTQRSPGATPTRCKCAPRSAHWLKPLNRDRCLLLGARNSQGESCFHFERLVIGVQPPSSRSSKPTWTNASTSWCTRR
jgi:hypothetical protein